MAEIVPFRAYRYNPERVELFQAVTQPYDKITPDMQEKYYAASPFNLIAVEKGKARPEDSPTDNVYTRAASTLEEWIAAGVLLRDSVPAVYAYFQEYIVPGSGSPGAFSAGGARRTRKGFIAVGRVEDYSAGVIFRHEQTLADPKADRLELLRHTRTHTGQLFMLYTDPARRVDALLDGAAQAKPVGEVRDEYGVVHKLWPITDAETLATIARAMADQRLVIADGHHRYETALAYRNECRARAASADRNAPHEFAMMTLFNTDVEGLTILPTHRVIAGVADFSFAKFCAELQPIFEWRAYRFANAKERDRSWKKFRADLETNGETRPTIGIYAGDGAFHLFLLRSGANLDALLPGVSPAQRRLDVVLLHRLILERWLGITADAVTRERNLAYEREADAAIAAVESGRAQLCCLLNAIPVGRVAEIALAGEVLPQKSTDFYPKLLSGLTLYRLE